jgi:hypothetical protein
VIQESLPVFLSCHNFYDYATLDPTTLARLPGNGSGTHYQPLKGPSREQSVQVLPQVIEIQLESSRFNVTPTRFGQMTSVPAFESWSKRTEQKRRCPPNEHFALQLFQYHVVLSVNHPSKLVYGTQIENARSLAVCSS